MPAQVSSRTSKFLHSYKEKYIDTGSIKPLTDTMIGLFFLSYAVAWPQVESLSPPQELHETIAVDSHRVHLS